MGLYGLNSDLINGEIYIDELLLPSRIVNALYRKKIYTVKDLSNLSEEQIVLIKGIGVKSLSYIKDALLKEIQYQKKYPSKLGKVVSPGVPEEKNLSVSACPENTSVTQAQNAKNKIYMDIEEYNANFKNKDNNDCYLNTVLNNDIYLDTLSLPTRVINSLEKNKIFQIKDIVDIPIPKLLNIKGIGRVLWKNISDELNNNSNTVSPSINSFLDLLLCRISDKREREIITERYGLLTGERKTLEEIGKHFGVTRERIRQIQKKILSKLRHHSNPARTALIEKVYTLFFSRSAIITDEEADELLPGIAESEDYDGSSVFDLFYDLKWIGKYSIGDIFLYFPLFQNINTVRVLQKVFNLIKSSRSEISLDEIMAKLGIDQLLISKYGQVESKALLKKYLKNYPHIIETQLEKYNYYKNLGTAADNWVKLLGLVLEKEGSPLHFMEITTRVNELAPNGKRLAVTRVHAFLIEDQIFAHIGVRGTYGLTKWGIKKESTADLVEECILKSGYRIHWRQVYEYVSRYERTNKQNIKAILNNENRFTYVGEGAYAANSQLH